MNIISAVANSRSRSSTTGDSSLRKKRSHEAGIRGRILTQVNSQLNTMLRRLENACSTSAPANWAAGLLLFAYLFFVIGSFTVGKAIRDALFLDEFGAMLLPYADMAIATIVGLWVSVYLRMARRANVRTLLMGSLVFFAINCLVFWYLTHISDAPWLTPVLYVWVGMFGVVAPAQVWTLANYVPHHARGQADVRLHRQRRDGRLDRRRLRDPLHRHAVRRRVLAARHGGLPGRRRRPRGPALAACGRFARRQRQDGRRRRRRGCGTA